MWAWSLFIRCSSHQEVKRNSTSSQTFHQLFNNAKKQEKIDCSYLKGEQVQGEMLM